MKIISLVVHAPHLDTPPPLPAVPPTSVGLGDVVAAVATPIARALNLSCVDPVTKQLRPDSPCARRKTTLNRIIPNFNPPPKP